MCEMCRRNSIRGSSLRGAACFARAASTMGLLLANAAGAKEMKAPPKPQNVLSPEASLERLLKGNARYVEGVSLRHDFKHEREALAGGQNPYAAILSCADLRIAPEYAFDSGRGDLFVCRVAGNFANTETVASMEYAVAVLGDASDCGAGSRQLRRGRCGDQIAQGRQPLCPGHMPSLVTGIAPAVKAVSQQGGDTLGNAIRQNVIDNVAKLSSATPDSECGG